MQAGSCASKHALLAEELAAIGLQSLPLLVVGSLVPKMLKTDPELAPGAHLSEVHECLTVLTPWAGPLRVDVTWDPLLVRHGLPGTLDWDGRTDMLLAGERAGRAGQSSATACARPRKRCDPTFTAPASAKSATASSPRWHNASRSGANTQLSGGAPSVQRRIEQS